MNLRQLTLHGFKSFADRTELEFRDGITAIVGPNGCGKSNISDAIRWVLGEQRASAIRSSRMDDAIFQGTTERRAVNRAEVGLTVSNEDGVLPVSYDEIEIRRTVFREGGSDYELNRSPCRLRDILDLCRDTGLGANAYAIIEQGMVDAILSDRTDDRRQIFEEAAGIGRYKDRRKAARRRLDAAEADLARLDDVIGEVESKVRSLAQQRGRARRHQTLREERLKLEVAVARIELDQVEDTLRELTERLASIGQDEPAARAALQTAETELEQHRLKTGELAREKAAVGARLEDVNHRIAELEREIAVADERRAHAERRLEQIEAERGALRERIRELEVAIERLGGERVERKHAADDVRERLDEVRTRQEAIRSALTEARRADEDARMRGERLSRRLAELEAAAAGADARAADAEARLERIGEERGELEAELSRLEQQGDLFVDRARELAARVAELESARDACSAELETLRAAEDDARQAWVQAEERADRLTARLAAVDALEREFQGFGPAVARVLGARGDFADGDRVRPLAEVLDLPPDRAAAVENALGSLLQVLLLDGPEAAEGLRSWLREHGREEGTIALLSDDALPLVRELLDAVEFVGRPPSEPVLLGRRERLEQLRADVAAAKDEREAAVEARARASDRVAEAVAEQERIAAELRSLQAELREVDADEAARAGHRTRTERAHSELEETARALRATAEKAREEASEARREYERIEAERAAHSRDRTTAAERRAEEEDAWDAVRDEEAEFRVAHARAESALGEIDSRIDANRNALDGAHSRLDALEREEAEHRGTLERLGTLRREGGERLETLFGDRDALAAELRGFDERLTAAEERTSELELRVRSLRQEAEQQSEQRHRLELRRTEAQALERRVHERLEAEWGRSYEQLAAEAEPVDGDLEVLREDLRDVVRGLDRIGPVNMLAIEEYEEEKQRLEFLSGQREDLIQARDDLQAAIRKINRTARERFMETFEEVRENFRDTFRTLFHGGECDVWLADADDPLDSAIEISASPGGKRTQRIHLLSGGERALTSLALLFAIYLVKPSPFCVFDEVDAPLDEPNVDRLIGMLEKFKSRTQFIIITHNPRTIEAADWIYGVTMEEPGVSSIVGVQLEEAIEAAGGVGA